MPAANKKTIRDYYKLRLFFSPGVLAVGFFADNPVPLDTTRGRCGLFKGRQELKILKL